MSRLHTSFSIELWMPSRAWTQPSPHRRRHRRTRPRPHALFAARWTRPHQHRTRHRRRSERLPPPASTSTASRPSASSKLPSARKVTATTPSQGPERRPRPRSASASSPAVTRARFVPYTPEPLRAARTCYDHIAGALAVALHDRLLSLGWITAAPRAAAGVTSSRIAKARSGPPTSSLPREKPPPHPRRRH